jgi:2-dehydro-3-deoxyphosphogluconate aldolase/(4S)-4-hydroxy-2-oxoglutarate aldolase
MDRDQIRARILDIGVVPGLRVSSADDALVAAEAVSIGGIPIVEVTMTIPGALDVISTLLRWYPEMIVGAGTVLDADTARHCVDAGAKFLTSTGLDLDVVRVGTEAGIVVFPGALTPSEIMAAWKAGSDFVKVFPCSHMGGDAYIRTLKTPFPHVPFIAAGGVNHTNAAAYIAAGAGAVGIGAHLIPRKAIELRQPHRITELAHRLVNLVREARDRKREGP